MSLTVPEFEIERLTISQRLELIGELWDSIPAQDIATNIPEWHRQELERRLDSADAHPDQGIPWKQVKARLRQKP
ncbi:MAG: addiction module protein [Gemmataceae bacterium]